MEIVLQRDNGLEQSTFSQEFQIEKNGLARNLSGYFLQYALYRLFCGNAHAVFVYGMQ